jgi:arsenate reductase
MSVKPLNVLFLCKTNSARSIMAEALLNAMGQGRYRAFSAGSEPGGELDRFALELLQRNRLPIEGLHPKSWLDFALDVGPQVDFAIALDAAIDLKSCGAIAGSPLRVQWLIADPIAASAGDEDRRRACFRIYNELQRRISLLVALPLDKLDREALQRRLADIGRPAD